MWRGFAERIEAMSDERKTVENTVVCIPCGYVFIDEDDYDTLGSESGICCPDCGSEKFISVKTIIDQRDQLLEACEAWEKAFTHGQVFTKDLGTEMLLGEAKELTKAAIATAKEG